MSYFSNGVTLFEYPLTGIVEEVVSSGRPGRVEAMASFWPARFYDDRCNVTLLPETEVKVVGRDGITLLIVPVNQVLPQDSTNWSRTVMSLPAKMAMI